ncbi:MATE family efflux transporter [Dellaglioa carnosa]|uniref:MATE family efflux transporter n=1 Tax=Dellaglioa carnosa TaxID=2995136 RepID=UPI0022A8890E|nr:MATE family efflux transporter [Dellaglioa carnosa]MCZ2493255.1 MATE family efflux transporter [Dellaglioa carnosa]
MRSLTSGNPAKLIFMFTIPLLVGNLFQQLYSISDTLIVGQTLGVDALAAVGSTGSIQFLIIGFAQGLTAGLSIITAQRFGAKDYRGVRKSFAAGLLISLVATIVLTAVSLFFVKDILTLMKTPPEIFGDAQTFISIIFGGIFASMAFNILSNVIRALGDSRTPLYFLIFASIINVGLELLFILVFHWGVAGAGFATIIAQSCSVVFCLVYIYRKIPILHIGHHHFKEITMKNINEHLYVALPMAFQASIIAIGAIMLQSALNGLGTTAVASTTAASKIDQLSTQPMMSFGIGMATFTAQNYGAKKYSRVLDGVKKCLLMSGTFSVIASLLVILFGQQLVTLFVGNNAPKVVALSQVYFNINGSFYLLLSVLFVIRYTLQGLGQSIIPTVAGVVELLMRSFAAIFLAGAFGYAGACFANPLAWGGSCVVLIYSYVKAVKNLKRLDFEQKSENELA